MVLVATGTPCLLFIFMVCILVTLITVHSTSCYRYIMLPFLFIAVILALPFFFLVSTLCFLYYSWSILATLITVYHASFYRYTMLPFLFIAVILGVPFFFLVSTPCFLFYSWSILATLITVYHSSFYRYTMLPFLFIAGILELPFLVPCLQYPSVSFLIHSLYLVYPQFSSACWLLQATSSSCLLLHLTPIS